MYLHISAFRIVHIPPLANVPAARRVTRRRYGLLPNYCGLGTCSNYVLYAPLFALLKTAVILHHFE